MGASGASSRRRSSGRYPPAPSKTSSEASKDDPLKRTPSKRKRTPVRNSRNAHGASVQAKEHHELDAAALDHGVSILDEYIAALSSLSQSADPSTAIATLNVPSPSSKRDLSSVDTIGVMTEVIDENPKPTLEYVLGVLGCPEIPKPLEERQRSHGARAFTAHFRNRSIRKKREMLEPQSTTTEKEQSPTSDPALNKDMPSNITEKNPRHESEADNGDDEIKPSQINDSEQVQTKHEQGEPCPAQQESKPVVAEKVEKTPKENTNQQSYTSHVDTSDEKETSQMKPASKVGHPADLEKSVHRENTTKVEDSEMEVAPSVKQLSPAQDVEMQEVDHADKAEGVESVGKPNNTVESQAEENSRQLKQSGKELNDDAVEATEKTESPDEMQVEDKSEKPAIKEQTGKSEETDTKKEVSATEKNLVQDVVRPDETLKNAKAMEMQDNVMTTKNVNETKTADKPEEMKAKDTPKNVETGEDKLVEESETVQKTEIPHETQTARKEITEVISKDGEMSEDIVSPTRNQAEPAIQGSPATVPALSAKRSAIKLSTSGEQTIKMKQQQKLKDDINVDEKVAMDASSEPHPPTAVESNTDKRSVTPSTRKQPKDISNPPPSTMKRASTEISTTDSKQALTTERKQPRARKSTEITKGGSAAQSAREVSRKVPMKLPTREKSRVKGISSSEAPKAALKDVNPTQAVQTGGSSSSASENGSDSNVSKDVIEPETSAKPVKKEVDKTDTTKSKPKAGSSAGVRPHTDGAVSEKLSRRLGKASSSSGVEDKTRATTFESEHDRERIVPFKKARHRRDLPLDEAGTKPKATPSVRRGRRDYDVTRPSNVPTPESSDSLAEAIAMASRKKVASREAKSSGGAHEPTRKPLKKEILKERAEAKLDSVKQEQIEMSEKKQSSEGIKSIRKEKTEPSRSRKSSDKAREKRAGSRRGASASVEIAPVVPRQTRLRRESSHLCEDGSSLMSSRDPYIIECYNVWKLVSKDKITIPFRKPVTVRDAPGYFDVVKHPMDLSTVKQHMEDKTIQTPEDFFEEMLLICSNAMLFNDPESDLFDLAIDLRRLMRRLIRPILRTWRDSRPEGEREKSNKLLEKGSDESESDESESPTIGAGASGRGNTRYPSRRSGVGAASGSHKERPSSPREAAPRKKKAGRGRKRTTQELSDGEDGGEYLTVRRQSGRGGRRGGSASAGRGGKATGIGKKGRKGSRAGSSAGTEEVVEEKKSKKRRLSGRRKRGEDD